MSYSIKITDAETATPLAGTVTYLDGTGVSIGTQEIPAIGAALNADLVGQAAIMDITAPGYLSAVADAGYFDGGGAMGLYKDTSVKRHSYLWLWILLGLYGSYKLKLFKL